MDRPTDSRVGSSGYSATGKLQVHNITITKPTDSASPQLTIAALQGVFNNTVTITFTTTSQGGMVPFMSYQLTNCGISSAHTTAGQTGLPTESYSLSFGQIQFTFQNMDQSGQILAHHHRLQPGDGTADVTVLCVAGLKRATSPPSP